MILHNVSSNLEWAQEMGQRLVDGKVFVPLTPGTDFQNKKIAFRLNEDHEMVKLKGKIRSNENVTQLSPRKSIRFRAFSIPRRTSPLLSSRSLASPKSVSGTDEFEGWLEKKSRLGYWQKRFFRLLTEEKYSTEWNLAYFDSTSSLHRKGLISSTNIRSVERLDTGSHGRSFIIRMMKSAKNANIILRAPTTEMRERWIRVLRTFALCLSPKDVVDRSPLAFVFTEDMKTQFAKLLTRKSYEKGEWIFRRGDSRNKFYMLESGRVAVYLHSKTTRKDQFYCEKGPVSIFGDFYSCHKTAVPPRRISLKAVENCTMLCALVSQGNEFISKYCLIGDASHFLLQAEVNRRLEKVEEFRCFNPPDVTRLKFGIEFHLVESGQVLHFDGEESFYFYVVFEGEILVTKTDPFTQEDVIVDEARRGDVVGKDTLVLKGIPSRGTAKASMDTMLLAIHTETFERFLSIVNVPISRVLRYRIINLIKRSRIHFFASLGSAAIYKLSKSCTMLAYKKGQVIFKEGDIGDAFYVIARGSVTVSIEKKYIKSLDKDSYFGEIALVLDDARTATCTAEDTCILLQITKKKFREFFSDKPDSLAEIELRIAGKRAQIRSVIYHPLGITAFLEFLKKEYAEESLEFWQEARAFRKWAQKFQLKASKEYLTIQAHASLIRDKYIREGAPREVNIGSKIANAIIKEVDAGAAGPKTFVQAEEEALTLLARDKMRTFRTSKEFKHLLSRINHYSVSEIVRLKGGKQRGGSNPSLFKGSDAKTKHTHHDRKDKHTII
ncbi:hypothetical protein AAMO2058_001419600 [Amorphochlora amoebiformis]